MSGLIVQIIQDDIDSGVMCHTGLCAFALAFARAAGAERGAVAVSGITAVDETHGLWYELGNDAGRWIRTFDNDPADARPATFTLIPIPNPRGNDSF